MKHLKYLPNHFYYFINFLDFLLFVSKGQFFESEIN